jgi:hypothetical protein
LGNVPEDQSRDTISLFSNKKLKSNVGLFCFFTAIHSYGVFIFFIVEKYVCKKDVSLSKKASTKKAPLLKSIMGWLDYKEK